MDLRLSDEQTQLVASFTDLFGKHSSPEQVRESESVGLHDGLWSALREVGLVEMGLPESAGGWGATLLDLALVAEAAGVAVAPAPIVDAPVAARLLAAIEHDAARAALADCLDNGAIATTALHPATSGGMVRLVPAGAVARYVIVRSGDRLLLVDTTATDVTSVNNLGAQPLADIAVPSDAVELVSGPDAIALHETALDEWLVLTAAAVVGVAARAHKMACEYATERWAFGAPIGSFQGISHPLADDATALDGARLLAYKAAWAKDAAPDTFAELAAMAFAFASDTTTTSTYDALHTHGGYGFMLEQDVQLHYRRARGWPRVFGSAQVGYRRAARARYGVGA